jgi:hypothetical protein
MALILSLLSGVKMSRKLFAYLVAGIFLISGMILGVAIAGAGQQSMDPTSITITLGTVPNGAGLGCLTLLGLDTDARCMLARSR